MNSTCDTTNCRIYSDQRVTKNIYGNHNCSCILSDRLHPRGMFRSRRCEASDHLVAGVPLLFAHKEKYKKDINFRHGTRNVCSIEGAV